MARGFTEVTDLDLIDLIHIQEAEFQRLETEAIRRATEGTSHEIVYRGVVVGEMMLYSDVLLDFLLRRIDAKLEARHG
jgi:hypothetical protein